MGKFAQSQTVYCRRIGYLQDMRMLLNPMKWPRFWTGIFALVVCAATQAQNPAYTATGPASSAGARFTDNMAERTRACTACHGEQGRAGPDGYYPRLAGKPAGYLHNQLRNFAQRRRHYDLMSRLIDPLTDDYLGEMAWYFSSLQLPYPKPTASWPKANNWSRRAMPRGAFRPAPNAMVRA